MPKCEVCGIEIVLLKSEKRDRIYTKKFCSRKCQCKNSYSRRKEYYNNYYGFFSWQKERKCDTCGKTFIPNYNWKKCCSKKCSKIFYKKAYKIATIIWKKNNPERVRASGRRCQKRARLLNPEKMRFAVKNRKHMIRASSGSTKTFSRAFTLKEWELIKESQNGICPDCGEIKKLTIDHIYPLSLGGKHCKENIQGLCHSCNSRKKDKIISIPHTSLN